MVHCRSAKVISFLNEKIINKLSSLVFDALLLLLLMMMMLMLLLLMVLLLVQYNLSCCCGLFKRHVFLLKLV